MLFDNHRDFIGFEEEIELSKYIQDGEDVYKFHDNFFNDEDISIKPGILNFILNIFKPLSEKEQKGRIAYLHKNSIQHVLLIIPEEFISNEIVRKIRAKDNRQRPHEIKKDFIEKIVNRFENNNIGCSIYIVTDTNNNSSRLNRGIDNISQWINLEELKQTVNLNNSDTNYKSYLIGFNYKITSNTQPSQDAISVNFQLNGEKKRVILDLNSAMYIANDRMFIDIPNSLDGTIIIENLIDKSNQKVIDISTANISKITSNNEKLNSEFFNDGYYDFFTVDVNDLNITDIELTFEDRFTLVLSKDISKVEDCGNIANIDLRRKYRVDFKQFTIPFEDELLEVTYYLVEINNKDILVASNSLPNCINAKIKIVADVRDKTFKVYNISGNSVIKFNNLNEVLKYDPISNKINSHNLATDTDDENIESVEPTKLLPRDYTITTKKIEFENSSIYYSTNGIVVEYAQYAIGSFNKKLQFGRYYIKYLGEGSIIDLNETQRGYEARKYINYTKTAGKIISRDPFEVIIDDENVTITNSIKKFSLSVQTYKNRYSIESEKSVTIPNEEFFSSDNIISIVKNDLELVSISIEAP